MADTQYPVLSKTDINEVTLAINLCNEYHVIFDVPPLSFVCPSRAAGHGYVKAQLCQEPVEEPIELETPSSHALLHNLSIKIFSVTRKVVPVISVIIP